MLLHIFTILEKKKTEPTKIYRKRQAYTELAYLLCELNQKKHLIFPYISLCLSDEEGKANTRFPSGEQGIGTGPGFPPDSTGLSLMEFYVIHSNFLV